MFRDVTYDRFWRKVDASAGSDGCWPWLGGRMSKGYGVCQIDGIKRLAHRISLIIATGRYDLLAPNVAESNTKNLACHRCGNAICVNPSHLYWGTTTDNALDEVRSGRIVQTVEKIRAVKVKNGARAVSISVAEASADYRKRRAAKIASAEQLAALLLVMHHQGFALPDRAVVLARKIMPS